MTDVANRYASIDLFLPERVHERVESLVSRSDADPKPFARQIDLWWTGVVIGVRLGTRTSMPSAVTKFNTGAILDSDRWRVTHLELLALAEEGPNALENPNRVILIASEYANAGMTWLIDCLLGEPEPILRMINEMDGLR